MKNRLIAQKLNIFVEGAKPPKEQVLAPAYFELEKIKRARAERKSPPKKSAFRTLMAASAFIALIFMAVYAIPHFMKSSPAGDKDVQQKPSYSIASLTGRAVAPSGIAEITENPVLTLNLPGQSERHMLYLLSGQQGSAGAPAVLASIYKVESGSGVDEIAVITDIEGGLTDYREFKHYSALPGYESEVFAQLDVYENGEYYSYLHLSYSDIDYYVIVMSPQADKAERYITELLSQT